MPNPQEEIIPTDEQVQAYIERQSKYVDEELPLLEKKVKIAELRWKLDNYVLNRRLVQQQWAEMNAPKEPEKQKT